MGTIQFKEVNCKNCYKCIRNCPVKAISLIDDHAQVIEDGCVLCGKCLHVCPQNAKSVKNELVKVKGFIEKKQKVYASIAPSFVAAFNVMDFQRISRVLEQLGFSYVEETAVGAAVVTEEYKKLMEKKQMKNIISTACPSVVSLVEKHYPELLDQLAPVVSPMVAHGKMLKELYGPRIKVVFIGPCLSKKEEFMDMQNDKVIDAVITFDEMEEWLREKGFSFEMDPELKETQKIGDRPELMERLYKQNSRYYPAPGGIMKSIGGFKQYSYKPLKFDGTERCMEVLESLSKGQISGYFLEMNSCAGGCLEGPCMNEARHSYIETREKLLNYVSKYNKEYAQLCSSDAKAARNGTGSESSAGADSKTGGQDLDDMLHSLLASHPAISSDCIQTRESYGKKFFNKSKRPVLPGEDEITKVLGTIGKYSRADELNCGACGYTTCREKAVAVIHGKAESHMCLPYMRQRAESISNVIIHSTPNAIIALSEDLEIQEANQAACRIFRLEAEEYKNRKIYEILECPDIYTVLETGTNVLNTKFCYENYNLVVEQSILYIKENRMIIIIMKDITRDEKKQLKMNQIKTETVEIAQKVIEKQMRVAQEIASLLGETTAETKVALTKLKNAIQSEMGDEQ